MEHHKEHKEHRKHRETGGTNEAEMDLKERPEARTNAKKIDDEAEEKKRGGHVRAKRRHGGGVKTHHVDHEGKLLHKRAERKRGGAMKEGMKHVGEVKGEHEKMHAGRKPRKEGGRASNENPFSSARKGEPAKGRKLEMEFE